MDVKVAAGPWLPARPGTPQLPPPACTGQADAALCFVHDEKAQSSVRPAPLRALPAMRKVDAQALSDKLASAVACPGTWSEIHCRAEATGRSTMTLREPVLREAVAAALVDGDTGFVAPAHFRMSPREHAFAAEFGARMREYLCSPKFEQDAASLAQDRPDVGNPHEVCALHHAQHLLLAIDDWRLDVDWTLVRPRCGSPKVPTRADPDEPLDPFDSPADERLLDQLHRHVEGQVQTDAFSLVAAEMRAANPSATEDEVDAYCRAQCAVAVLPQLDLWINDSYEGQHNRGSRRLRSLEATAVLVQLRINRAMIVRAQGHAVEGSDACPPFSMRPLAPRAHALARELDFDFGRGLAVKLPAEIRSGALTTAVTNLLGTRIPQSRAAVRRNVILATVAKLVGFDAQGAQEHGIDPGRGPLSAVALAEEDFTDAAFFCSRMHTDLTSARFSLLVEKYLDEYPGQSRADAHRDCAMHLARQVLASLWN
ncbi:hypothetical protein [Ramlibacter albus]|uniref:Uncharacterized protein n=1 Tax=Ramlibacter albus TaxID=2079448 RepID=A0A923MC31_9BURK|nr:hypothetical protein [Ramlibacter albus]MBC5766781.1 hypothetical protein [Ramlibacter albus]